MILQGKCLLYYKENDRKPAPTIELSFKRCTKYRTSFLLYYNRGDSMNDKVIRKILINYLLAERQDIRIYQEKSIGSSICDVMAVSSHLTGYYGNDDYHTAEILYDIAGVYFNQGDCDSALSFLNSALDIFVIVYGDEHKRTIEVCDKIKALEEMRDQ